jgi:hypothetical protein
MCMCWASIPSRAVFNVPAVLGLLPRIFMSARLRRPWPRSASIESALPAALRRMDCRRTGFHVDDNHASRLPQPGGAKRIPVLRVQLVVSQLDSPPAAPGVPDHASLHPGYGLHQGEKQHHRRAQPDQQHIGAPVKGQRPADVGGRDGAAAVAHEGIRNLNPPIASRSR